MEIKGINHLEKKKNKAIFLGCGSSIKHITKDQYESIKKEYDIWVSNGFFMHDFIQPDFYHLEVNLNNFGELFNLYFRDAIPKIKNSEFIFSKQYLHYLNYIDMSFKETIYAYNSYQSIASETGYDNHPFFVRDSGCNLSKIVDIMIKMKYQEISFAGVDLSNSLYFWTDKENIPAIINFSKPDENTRYSMHHSFSNTIKFLKGISKFEKNRISFYNLSKDSLLNDILEYKEIFWKF